MISPTSFHGMLAVIHNSDSAVPHPMYKQLELTDISHEIKAAYSSLPPEVSKAMFAEYEPTKEATLQLLMNNLLTKEFVLTEAAQGNNLDKDWLNESAAGTASVGIDDEWNTGYDSNGQDNEFSM